MSGSPMLAAEALCGRAAAGWVLQPEKHRAAGQGSPGAISAALPLRARCENHAGRKK